MIPRSQLFASTPEIDLVRADRGLFRVAGIGNALLPNAAMAYGLQDLRGYDGMQPSVHGEVAGISHKGGAYRVIKEGETTHVLDLMNVKYIFALPDEQLPAPHFTRLVDRNRRYGLSQRAARSRERSWSAAFVCRPARLHCG